MWLWLAYSIIVTEWEFTILNSVCIEYGLKLLSLNVLLYQNWAAKGP